MPRKTLYLLGILFAIAIGTLLYAKLCSGCIGERVSKTLDPSITTKVRGTERPSSFPFAISEDDFTFSIEKNFNFHVSSPSLLMPITPEIRTGINELKDYLASKDNSVLRVIGHYGSTEENSTSLLNLGFARASSVKNHLVLQGIPSTQIETEGKLNDALVREGNTIYGPISYLLSKKIEEQDSPETNNP